MRTPTSLLVRGSTWPTCKARRSRCSPTRRWRNTGGKTRSKPRARLSRPTARRSTPSSVAPALGRRRRPNGGTAGVRDVSGSTRPRTWDRPVSRNREIVSRSCAARHRPPTSARTQRQGIGGRAQSPRCWRFFSSSRLRPPYSSFRERNRARHAARNAQIHSLTVEAGSASRERRGFGAALGASSQRTARYAGNTRCAVGGARGAAGLVPLPENRCTGDRDGRRSDGEHGRHRPCERQHRDLGPGAPRATDGKRVG